MNASPAQNVARAAGILLIVILAAAAGLAAGNVLQQVREEGSITAQASFSRDALDDLGATRGDRPATATYPDYAIRHSPATSAVSDWALRHPALSGPSDPSTELRGQRKAN